MKTSVLNNYFTFDFEHLLRAFEGDLGERPPESCNFVNPFIEIEDKLPFQTVPASCSSASYAAGEPCTFQYLAQAFQMKLQFSVSKCSATSLPSISVSCEGKICTGMYETVVNPQSVVTRRTLPSPLTISLYSPTLTLPSRPSFFPLLSFSLPDLFIPCQTNNDCTQGTSCRAFMPRNLASYVEDDYYDEEINPTDISTTGAILARGLRKALEAINIIPKMEEEDSCDAYSRSPFSNRVESNDYGVFALQEAFSYLTQLLGGQGDHEFVKFCSVANLSPFGRYEAERMETGDYDYRYDRYSLKYPERFSQLDLFVSSSCVVANISFSFLLRFVECHSLLPLHLFLRYSLHISLFNSPFL